MACRQTTRLASLLLACISAFWSCQESEPPTALAAGLPASAAAPPAAPPPAVLTAPPPAAPPPAVLTAPPPAAPPPAKSPGRALTNVLVLGDSLSDERVGGGGFLRSLREQCRGVTFDNRAKGGFMVNQIRKRLETEVLPEGNRYSHAIVFAGVNDLYSDRSANRSLARIEADLTKIYDTLAARGTEVIALTVAPWAGFKRWYTPERGRNTATLNAWILDKAANGVIADAVDVYPLLSCGDPERLCPELAAPYKDGLHFGKLGHRKIADALLAGPFRSCRG